MEKMRLNGYYAKIMAYNRLKNCYLLAFCTGWKTGGIIHWSLMRTTAGDALWRDLKNRWISLYLGN